LLHAQISFSFSFHIEGGISRASAQASKILAGKSSTAIETQKTARGAEGHYRGEAEAIKTERAGTFSKPYSANHIPDLFYTA
jgi:hypothetical protein